MGFGWVKLSCVHGCPSRKRSGPGRAALARSPPACPSLAHHALPGPRAENKKGVFAERGCLGKTIGSTLWNRPCRSASCGACARAGLTAPSGPMPARHLVAGSVRQAAWAAPDLRQVRCPDALARGPARTRRRRYLGALSQTIRNPLRGPRFARPPARRPTTGVPFVQWGGGRWVARLSNAREVMQGDEVRR